MKDLYPDLSTVADPYIFLIKIRSLFLGSLILNNGSGSRCQLITDLTNLISIYSNLSNTSLLDQDPEPHWFTSWIRIRIRIETNADPKNPVL
jgi:hypothetical protein